MARARPGRTPDQLTLEDWAEMVSVSHEMPETQGGEAATVDALASADSAEMGYGAQGTSVEGPGEQATRHHQVATELIDVPGALLTRSHLRELGLERRAIDAVFRKLPVVALPGYSRPMIHVEEYLDLIDEHTYRDDRVRPLGSKVHG